MIVRHTEDYNAARKKRADAAEQVYNFYNSNFKEETERAVRESVIYKTIERLPANLDRTGLKTEVEFDLATSEEEIFKTTGNDDENVYVVLNFASYNHPGGQFITGSSAQEECLCHSSNLYNILSSERLKNEFYGIHVGHSNDCLYGDDLIYTPNVLFIKQNEYMDRNSHIKTSYSINKVYADVITCAAPNKKAACRYKKIDPYRVNEVMAKRINAVLSGAYRYSREFNPNKKITLILGAFGCGVFGNDINLVGHTFGHLIAYKNSSDYYGLFHKIIFAIPDQKLNKFVTAFKSYTY